MTYQSNFASSQFFGIFGEQRSYQTKMEKEREYPNVYSGLCNLDC